MSPGRMQLFQIESGEIMSAKEIFELVAERYKDKPDDFVLSLGHHELMDKSKPMGMWNLPEFCAYLAISMREVRAFAAGVKS